MDIGGVYRSYKPCNAEYFPQDNATFETSHFVGVCPEFYTVFNFIPRSLINKENHLKVALSVSIR